MRLVFFLIVALASARSVSYNLAFQANGSIDADALIIENGPFATFSWYLPDGAEVNEFQDSSGAREYSIEGNRLFSPMIAGGGEQQIRISLKIENASECEGPVCLAGISLSSWDGVRTSTTVRFENASLFVSRPVEKTNSTARLEAEGPVYLKVGYLLEDGIYAREVSPHYVLVSLKGGYSLALNEVETQFKLIENLTSLSPPCERFLILESNRVAEFAGGEYSGACLIKIRPSLLKAPTLSVSDFAVTATILHETTHAFMEELPTSQAFWFGEGVSEFVSTSASDILRGVNASSPYAIRKTRDYVGLGNGSREILKYEVHLAQRISLQELERFYKKGGKWTPAWNPDSNQTEEEREFGYAYSHFIVNSFVQRFGEGALRKTLGRLLKLKDPTGARGPWYDSEKVLRAMRSSIRDNLSDDEFFYPFKEVLLNKGERAFRESVTGLAADSEKISEAEKMISEVRFPKPQREIVNQIVISPTTQERVEAPDWLVNSIMLIMLAVPLVAIYFLYKVARKFLP